jgi:C1A family cysteine protease
MMHLNAGTPYDELSAAFVYIEERDREGTSSEDSGAYPRDGCYTLKHYGIPTNAVMPYSDRDFTTQPTPAVFTDAATRKIKSYYRVLSQHSIKSWIAKNVPINMGFLVYQGMESSRNGVIPMPGATEQPLGGHDIILDGYSDRPDWPGGGYFRLFNSWGESAGDGHGDYFLPYAYAGNPQLAWEFWRIVLS